MQKQLLHLQGLGKVPAVPASEIKVGDILSWNYGYRSYQVVSIKEVGAKSLEIAQRNLKDGKVWTKRFLKTRLIANG